MSTYTIEQLYSKIQELNNQKETLRQALIARLKRGYPLFYIKIKELHH